MVYGRSTDSLHICFAPLEVLLEHFDSVALCALAQPLDFPQDFLVCPPMSEKPAWGRTGSESVGP